MLSRVAERIFWLSRYMERTENTARLVKVYSNLLLDLPKSDDVSWFRLLEIFGSSKIFDEMYNERSELNIMKFLLTDKNYYGSLISSLKFARENARTTRDVFPIEVWDVINEIYLSFQKIEGAENSRSKRYSALNEVIYSGQRFEGIVSSGMNRSDIYSFFVLGKLIERADMTTRVLDVGNLMLSTNNERIAPYKGIIWSNLLKSINSYQMYRRNIRMKINGPDVIRFLLMDPLLPRSVRYCVDTILHFTHKLPKSASVKETFQKIIAFIESIDFAQGDELYMHNVMDDIQKMLIDAGNSISATWFNIEDKHYEENICQ